MSQFLRRGTVCCKQVGMARQQCLTTGSASPDLAIPCTAKATLFPAAAACPRPQIDEWEDGTYASNFAYLYCYFKGSKKRNMCHSEIHTSGLLIIHHTWPYRGRPRNRMLYRSFLELSTNHLLAVLIIAAWLAPVIYNFQSQTRLDHSVNILAILQKASRSTHQGQNLLILRWPELWITQAKIFPNLIVYLSHCVKIEFCWPWCMNELMSVICNRQAERLEGETTFGRNNSHLYKFRPQKQVCKKNVSVIDFWVKDESLLSLVSYATRPCWLQYILVPYIIHPSLIRTKASELSCHWILSRLPLHAWVHKTTEMASFHLCASQASKST